MLIDDFIINVFVCVDDFIKSLGALRKSGPSPHLSDSEVITMEIVGEFLEMGSDKEIYEYFKNHWHHWFPKLTTTKTFVTQSSNLYQVKEIFRQFLVLQISPYNDIFLSDGFPIPTCHIKRVRKKNPLRGEASFGYCATKDEHYFGFKGHLVTNQNGLILNFTIAPANVDERDVLPELVSNYQGDLIADKGLIRPELTEELASHNLQLHTPLRSNMKDSRPKGFVYQIMNVRRRIETVIGQLAERFKIQSMRVKDLRHLSVKVGRKILAHTVAFFFANSLAFDGILN